MTHSNTLARSPREEPVSAAKHRNVHAVRDAVVSGVEVTLVLGAVDMLLEDANQFNIITDTRAHDILWRIVCERAAVPLQGGVAVRDREAEACVRARQAGKEHGENEKCGV